MVFVSTGKRRLRQEEKTRKKAIREEKMEKEDAAGRLQADPRKEAATGSDVPCAATSAVHHVLDNVDRLVLLVFPVRVTN